MDCPYVENILYIHQMVSYSYKSVPVVTTGHCSGR